MDIEVRNMEHEIYIEVRDRDPYTSQMIGHVTTRVNFFAVPGGRAEWLELFYEGYPAGRIHFRSEFTPQIAEQFVQPMIAPQVIIEQPAYMVNPVVARMGLLKLHLIEAHLTHNTNPGLFDRMDPFVIIKVNLQEWRSAVCMGGGKNPRWEFQFMEHQVLSLDHEVYIEVRDRDPMITEMIGSARVPLRFFCVPTGLTEWIELFFMGMPAGRIQFRSEYFPEISIMGGNTTVIV